MPGTLISALFSPLISDPPDTSAITSQKPVNGPLATSSHSASVPIPPGGEPTPTAATPAGGLKMPLVDLNKGHREAVSALVQVRSEREAMGVERREGVRRRVKEMNEAAEAGGSVDPSPSHSARGMEVERVSEPMNPLPWGTSVNNVDEGTISEPTPSSRDRVTERGALAPPNDTVLEPGGTDNTTSNEP